MVLIVDNFLCGQTEDKGILFAHFFYDLHVGTVHGSQSQGTVQHELHVTGTGRFLTCGRNLLGDICCRKDDLCVGYIVVLNKYDLDLAVNSGIVIYYIRYGVDQLDGQFCVAVAGCCLRAEDKGSGIEIQFRMLLQFVIQVHYMQNIEQLSLVLMQTLYLYIEDGSGIYFDTVVLQNIFCQTYFVLVLDVHEFLLCLLVIRIYLQAGDLRQIGDPVVTYMSRYPVSQQRIRMQQETSLGNTVGLVVEALREHLVEVLQFLLLQNLGMQSCHAVD